MKLVKQKKFKRIVDDLEAMLGTQNAGVLIEIVRQSIINTAKVNGTGVYIRSIEIKYNNFFSTKYDCENNKYVAP